MLELLCNRLYDSTMDVKIGNPNNGWVKTESIFSERVFSLCFWSLNVSLSAPVIKLYFAFVIIVSLSSFSRISKALFPFSSHFSLSYSNFPVFSLLFLKTSLIAASFSACFFLSSFFRYSSSKRISYFVAILSY